MPDLHPRKPLILALNGPPGVGKDFLALYLRQHRDFAHFKFATPLKLMLAELFDVSPQFIEKEKDQLIHGHTIRQWLIELSENFVKPRAGRGFFGKMLAFRLLKSFATRIVISDCGFVAELEALANALPSYHIQPLSIAREGHTFEFDSRSYLPSHVVGCLPTFTTTNPGDDNGMHLFAVVADLLAARRL